MNELQICTRNDSIQFDGLHVISNMSFPPDINGSVTRTSHLEKARRASSCVLNFGKRLVNWVRCGVSNES